jgi:two-component system nitrogen regulation response regulator GlnG
MEDPDYTRTSRVSACAGEDRPLLGLTLLWHPDPARIGAQFAGPDGEGVIALSRYAPAFGGIGAADAPLEDQRVARVPLSIRRLADDSVLLTPPPSRMTVELNGVPLTAPACLEPEQVESGAVLALGGSVLVCIHWMRSLPMPASGSPLVGVSDAALRMRAQVAQAARTALPVLLLGETGTGKELAARAIHGAGPQRDAPLVSVNMAALSESLAAADLFGAERGAYTGAQAARQGYFAEAGSGTLFLDEIGDTPAAVQPMLLRVLETGEYRPLGARADQMSRARLIAATDRDLAAGAFNQPLLRRLEGFVIRMPPLRERRADIGVLAAARLAAWQRDTGRRAELPVALVAAMCLYAWPGNVRQLANVVTRALIALDAGSTPSFSALVEEPPPAAAGTPARPVAPAGGPAARGPGPAALSDEQVLLAMESSGWEIQAAARALGISRPSLYKLLESHPQIRRPEAIPIDELRRALDGHAGKLLDCASRLRTPLEALRRHARASGLLGGV